MCSPGRDPPLARMACPCARWLATWRGGCLKRSVCTSIARWPMARGRHRGRESCASLAAGSRSASRFTRGTWPRSASRGRTSWSRSSGSSMSPLHGLSPARPTARRTGSGSPTTRGWPCTCSKTKSRPGASASTATPMTGRACCSAAAGYGRGIAGLRHWPAAAGCQPGQRGQAGGDRRPPVLVGGLRRRP